MALRTPDSVPETPPEEFKRLPLCFRITPSQQVQFDALRRKLHLTRTGLIEAALDTFFRIHDERWPSADRRRP